MFFNSTDLYKEALKKYAGHHVYDLVKSKGKAQLKNYLEQKDLTVMFIDVKGMSILTDHLSSEGLVELLNIYLSVSFDIIEKNNGTIINLNGDEIIAVFGLKNKKHANDACHVALSINDAVNSCIDENCMPKLSLSIGINTGEILIGNYGGTTRIFYTIVGDHVNLGSRLALSNRIYNSDVIISEFTNFRIKDKCLTRELDIIRVKGLNDPVKIFELVGE